MGTLYQNKGKIMQENWLEDHTVNRGKPYYRDREKKSGNISVKIKKIH